MKDIPISSCHACNPEVWESVGKSEGDYLCKKCGRIINEILRRKEDG